MTKFNDSSMNFSFTKWSLERLPEYIWIGLIFGYYGRNEGMRRLFLICKKLLEIAESIALPRMSEIFSLNDAEQSKVYQEILKIISKDVLSPLTLIFTYSTNPLFAENFVTIQTSVDDRLNILMEILRKTTNNQSELSTDIRYIVLFYLSLSNKLHLGTREQVDLLTQYSLMNHENPVMQQARPFIRSTEVMVFNLFEISNEEYTSLFWERVSKMTECSLFKIQFDEEKRDTDHYIHCLKEIYSYLCELFTNASPLDNKMLVLLGIATYSFKRIKEVSDHKLFNTIVGRSSVRVLIENYIMMKYLVKNESSYEDIWRDFQEYGIGQFKLIVEKSKEHSTVRETSHVDYKYLDILVSDFKHEYFLDMDTRYFDNLNIRKKAEIVDEKELYDLYYDYDSAFEHGLWGAIRESSLLSCNNPLHHYHCVPDINDEQNLKSVWPDCIMVMNKTIDVLDELYGIPDSLVRGILDFERE
ncbi:MAG: hypothetical protein JXQ82_08495 [Methanomicrobiaceae archaeon]|nr:hypothetical protein [Methanomicrobiaceae archaeon]